jgi:hypothetical protein
MGCLVERRRVGRRVEVRPAPQTVDAWREAIEEADRKRGYTDAKLFVRAEVAAGAAGAARDLALIEQADGWYGIEDLGPQSWPLACPVRIRVQLIGEEGLPAITDVVLGGRRDGQVFAITARALRVLPLGRLLDQAVATRSPRRPFPHA